ncbi:hypothetical protein [Streptomyces sp. NPDC088910]|uniref:hypothetical protein n=1 Tax=Streptomyces sp. NPDC088910 TaxID=3365911 RepID=UPI00380199E3
MKPKISSEDALWDHDGYGTRTILYRPPSRRVQPRRLRTASALGIFIIECLSWLMPSEEREGYVDEQASVFAEAPTVREKLQELWSSLTGLFEIRRRLRELVAAHSNADAVDKDPASRAGHHLNW